MLVRKEIIRPGTFWYQDQADGSPRKLDVTSDSIRHFHTTGQQMLAAGLSVPIPLEHQPDATPLNAAEKAANALKHNAGWVNGYEIGEVEETRNGRTTTVKDVLFGVLDVRDEAAAKKLVDGTIRHTSPWINTFTDGDGRDWKGVISHLALTSRPRITRQQPFQSIAAALSLAGPNVPRLVPAKLPISRSICLSLAGLLEDDQPKYPNAFQLWSGGAALGTMPPPAKKKAAPSDDESEVEAEEATEEIIDEDTDTGGEIEQPIEEEATVSPAGDISIYEVLADLLDTVGIPIPPGTDASNFADRIYKAAMMKVKALASEADALKNQDDMMPDEPGYTNQKQPTVAEQPPMYMSLADAKKIKDPQMQKMAIALAMNAQETTNLRQNVMNAAKVSRQRRIDALCRRVPQPEFRAKLEKQSLSAQFSIGNDGIVQDSFSSVLDILDAGIRDMPSMLTTPSAQLSEQGPPAEYEGQMSDERRKAVARELAKNAGVAYSAA